MPIAGTRCEKLFGHRIPDAAIGHREPFLNRLVLSE